MAFMNSLCRLCMDNGWKKIIAVYITFIVFGEFAKVKERIERKLWPKSDSLFYDIKVCFYTLHVRMQCNATTLYDLKLLEV